MSTSFRAIRLLHYAVLICLEATLVHLVGLLVSGATSAPLLNWWVLVAVVALAALVTSRFEPVNANPAHIRYGTGLIGIVVIAWATAAHQGAYSPFGVLRTLPRLFSLDDTNFLAIYLGLIASLWAWWRGSSVLDQGHSEVIRSLRRSVVILIGVLALQSFTGFDPIFGSSDGRPLIGLVVEVAGFLLLGFVALSLTRIIEAAALSTTHGAEWRWLRSSLASTSAVVMLGLLIIAFVADPAGSVLRAIMQWLVFGLVALMAPFLAVILLLVDFIRKLVPQQMEAQPVIGMATAVPAPTPAPINSIAIPDALLAIPTIILLLLPIVVLLLVILFARRRRSRVDLATGEERESIFSWGALGADLAGLLRGLRRPAGDGGLRGALRRLLAEDPATRIRRRYVELLLKGEDAGRQRPPHQTPHEFAPTLAQQSDDSPAIDTLTQIYERARYAPASVDDATATAADRAWATLNHDEPPRRG